MSGSDSEAFESADEDFDLEISKNNKKKNNEPKQKEESILKVTEHSTNEIVKKTEEKVDNVKESLKKEDNDKLEKTTDGWEDNWDDWGDDDNNPNNSRNLTLNSVAKEKENSEPVAKSSSDVFKDDSTDSIQEPKFVGVFDKLSKEKESSWGWKPWENVVSLISTATEGVSTLTTNVSKGLSTVIESGIGVPNPEEFAKLEKQNIKSTPSPTTDEPKKEDTLRSIVSGVTQISNRVITGGLDTLEGIGKKTMTIIQENDHGLLSKRKLLGLDNEKPVLSQVLREAKAKSEETEKNLKAMQKHLYKKQIHYETLFDDYNGLVHLEALEMLSKQSSLKLQSLLTPLIGKALKDMEETLNEVRELCELPDQDDDFDCDHSVEELSNKLATAVEDLDIQVDFKEILNCWTDNISWLDNESTNSTANAVHDKALHCLAQTTALAVQKMHKLAESLLILEHHSTANEADSLVQLTTIFCWHLNGISTRFSDKISEIEVTDDSNSLITSIFLESNNSVSYIQKTFQLFIPILQFGAA